MFKKALASLLIALSLSMIAAPSHAIIREGRVVFSDGTPQGIYPFVPHPEIFISLAQSYNGIENVILNVDGSFSLSYYGASYMLLPSFNTTVQSLDPGEVVAPSLSNYPDGSIKYVIQDGDLLVTCQLFITLA